MTLADLWQGQHRSLIHKTVEMSLMGKNFQEIGKCTEYNEFEKEIDIRGYSDPVVGLYTCI